MGVYIGRFAPSPSGPLHQGSLVAAVGSYLQAKANKGLWLVRIEDIDPPREVPGASDSILRSLDSHGLHWDQDVVYQSARLDAYAQAIEKLVNQGVIYDCYCSKKKINDLQLQGIDGFCHPQRCISEANAFIGKSPARRIYTNNKSIEFMDKKYALQSCMLSDDIGDFIVERADGIVAYHLAVVVDDHWQGVTEVVRGLDLLTQTFRHIYLQTLFGYSIPHYFHLPLVFADDGVKLSKQKGATALNNEEPGNNLFKAYKTLELSPPFIVAEYSVDESLLWATDAWRKKYFTE